MTTPMTVREAILKTADSIERHPRLFNFSSCVTANPDCGTPGCALGWLAFHLGVAGNNFTKVCELIGLTDSLDNSNHGQFYSRMNALDAGREWKVSAALCATTLRQYADKYHPAPARTDFIPSSVREIFAEHVNG